MKFSRSFSRTGGVGDPETTDLDRRAADNVGMHWKVKEVDYKSTPPKYRVERGDPNDEDNYNLSDWLPAAGHRAQGDVHTHFLEVGERVMMLSEGGELSTAQIMPAGTYTKDEDRKAGTDKAGVSHLRTKNKQEISFDRDTGEYKIVAKGEKKDDDSSSGGGSGGSSSSSSSGGSKKIPGSFHFEHEGMVFTMKDGEFKVAAGNDTLSFKGGKMTVTVGGKALEYDGSTVKHDGHDIGKMHKHKDVMRGGDLTGEPE